jgi:hypothetical protein
MFTSPTYPPKTATFVQLTGNAYTSIPAGAVQWSISSTGGAYLNGTHVLNAIEFGSQVAVLTPIAVMTTGFERAAVFYAS